MQFDFVFKSWSSSVGMTSNTRWGDVSKQVVFFAMHYVLIRFNFKIPLCLAHLIASQISVSN